MSTRNNSIPVEIAIPTRRKISFASTIRHYLSNSWTSLACEMRFSSPKIHHFSNEFWCRVPILVVVVIVVAVATRPVVNSDCCDSFYCYCCRCCCCMLFPGFSRPTCSLLVVIFRFAALRHAIQFTTKRLKLAVSEEALCLYMPVGSTDGHEQTVAICFNMHLACLVVLASRFALLLADLSDCLRALFPGGFPVGGGRIGIEGGSVPVARA